MNGLRKNRFVEFDQIRIIAMLFVLAIHTIQFCDSQSIPYNSIWYVRQFTDTIFLTCNGMFFMLSGKFALNKVLNNTEEYKNYYIGKIIKIIIPFFIVSLIYYFEELITINNYSALININWILDFSKKLIQGNIPNATHFWFVYAIVGVYLAAPFFAKIVNNISNNELKLLMGVIIGFQTLQVLASIFSLSPAVNYAYFGLAGWTSYFILGYAVDKLIVKKKHRKLLFLLGISALILTLIQCRFLTNYCANVRNYSPLFMLITCSMYIMIRDCVKIKNKFIKQVISFLAKYSFSFYLIHMIVIIILERHIKFEVDQTNYFIYFAIIYVLAFIISLICSVVLDNILFLPLERILKKIFIVKESSIYYKKNKRIFSGFIGIILIFIISMIYIYWIAINKPIIIEFPSSGNTFVQFNNGWLDQNKDEKYRWVEQNASFKILDRKCTKIKINGYVPENFKEVTSIKLLINDEIVYDNSIQEDGSFCIDVEMKNFKNYTNPVFTMVFNDIHKPGENDLDIRSMSACISYIEID